MPILDNPRHERFAQELASGKSADEAYGLAGYKPNRGNATTLKQQQSISMRVTELLCERESIHAQATADAIKESGLTKEWVIETLMENVSRAMQAKPVRADDEGGAVGEYQYQGNVANRALELLGKELGMFVERKEDVTSKRTLQQIDARIYEFFGIGREGRAAGIAGRAGTAPSGNEAVPNVPGTGTAAPGIVH